ncbi:MAG: dienelactone hydrolase family protein [Acidimicrobiia bacterium]|nr:dienelactone hydrolase family protein [Acidimicrobiia bacterium]MYC45306.1 dienelactone hydrolase family protein [Acidimicrobiia bacterium]MYI20286.1 dienelactone hydrolase family protein [Acidimicrobiia bacterium]
MIRLTAADGHELDAYEAGPADAAAGIVIVQEIFGVNAHIRDVVDRYAALGYRAVAPALFDRLERGVELGYTDETVIQGRAMRGAIDWDDTVRDVGAAVGHLASNGPVGVVGYCYGGSLAWLAAHSLPVAAAVGYYGGQIIQFLDRRPKAPIMLLFGEVDYMIPLSDVEEIMRAHPTVPVHVYPGADHGFNCDARDSYHPEAAALALERTLAFLAEAGVRP